MDGFLLPRAPNMSALVDLTMKPPCREVDRFETGTPETAVVLDDQVWN